MDDERRQRSISRRDIVRAGARAVPLLPVAVAAPKAVASTDPPGLVDYVTVTVEELTESADTGLAWSGATVLYPWSADGPGEIGFSWSAVVTRDGVTV